MTVDNPGASGTGSLPTDAQQKAKTDLHQASEKLSSDLSAASQQASRDMDAIKREAKSQIGAATEHAKSFATDQKDLAAQQITGIAGAISKVADELEGEQATTARYARDLAKGLDRFGKDVENKGVDELMHTAQQFGRSQPLAFLGAAALAGFVASRFAGASAHRHQRAQASSGTGSSSGTGYSSGSGYSGASGSTGSSYGSGASASGGSSYGSSASRPAGSYSPASSPSSSVNTSGQSGSSTRTSSSTFGGNGNVTG